MNKPLALIIDDEPDIRELLDITLSRMNITTRSAGTVAEALARLEEDRFDLCLADMRLPDGDGIDIVRHVNSHYPGTPIAVITAHGNMETAVEALKAGAFDFVSKPVDLPMLRRLVETALQLPAQSAAPAPGPTRETAQPADPLSAILGKSAAIEHVRKLIGKLARNQAPVFISGESGTGKEMAARLIHRLSPRAEGPFVAVNCGAIPQELMESEFFGHVKGSFTGAVSNKQGLFQAADGGTLFLDEVADLPQDMQVKLLRAIQEKSVRPVGATREENVDVRIVSATHKNLGALVAEGRFRQDLYYRIHVIELPMPPLRKRREDIPLHIDDMLKRAAQGVEPRPRIARDALKALYDYGFPGNVRELENILERATALCEKGMIEVEDLGLSTPDDPAEPDTGRAAPGQIPANLEDYLADKERNAILGALEQTRWNRTAAARELGISFRALRYRMEKLGLTDDDPPNS